MKCRGNRRTGDKISEIGRGSAYLPEVDFGIAVKILQTACEGGINYFDLAAGNRCVVREINRRQTEIGGICHEYIPEFASEIR